MTANLVATILPAMLCAWELLTVWQASHSLADIIADAPALDGVLTLSTLI